MSERRTFRRKVAYVIAILVLWLPVSLLSMPASGGRDGAARSPGGKLARLRAEHDLAQANLGEIDPASETMKLATFGLRGIASNILWEKANRYKKTEDWTNFAATLDQIIHLQPNFVTVWQYQAWNLSYNLSVEFDDYHDRYMYVMRGIRFLEKGERYNRNDPRLLWDLGWFTGQKIGRADEKRQYRRLFREDDDYHAGSGRTKEQRDNWLVGKEWFLKGQEAIDVLGKPLKGKSPLLYHSNPPMSQINYSEAIQEEGTHGEVAQIAWRRAGDEWHAYGERPLLTTYGIRISLNDMETRQEEAQRYKEALDSMVENIRYRIEADRYAKLSDAEKQVWDMPAGDRSEEQHELYYAVQRKLRVTNQDVADRIKRVAPEKAKEAARLARLATEAEREADIIDSNRHIVNFDYWRGRCLFEQDPNTLAGRELCYNGDQALAAADLIKAKELYQRGMTHWREAFDSYPKIENEGTVGEEVVDVIVRYRRVLDQLDEKLPHDFILRDIVERHDREERLKGVFAEEPEEQQDSQDSKPQEEPATEKEEEGKQEKNGEAEKKSADN